MPNVPGDEDDNLLTGSVGDDTIVGLSGRDRLITDLGIDLAHGGASYDELVVDYSAVTSKVVMTKPTDTGIQRSGTGQPAPGGSTFVEAFGSDSKSYSITYSHIDVSQADDIWLVAGNPDLTFDSLSNENKTIAFNGTFEFTHQTLGTFQIGYSISGTVSEGSWQQADEELGGDGFASVKVLDESFTVNYALTIDLPPQLEAFFSLFADDFEDEVAPSLRGAFFYDDKGASGSITAGAGNSVNYDDIESLEVHAGSGGSRLFGGLFNDTFYAGSGVDVMTGGAESDIFVFETLNAVAKKADRITDFTKADTISLASLDPFPDTEVDDAFKFIKGEGKDFKHAGEIAWHHEGSGKNAVTVIEGNLDRDAKAEFLIELDGKIKLTADCFEL